MNKSSFPLRCDLQDETGQDVFGERSSLTLGAVCWCRFIFCISAGGKSKKTLSFSKEFCSLADRFAGRRPQPRDELWRTRLGTLDLKTTKYPSACVSRTKTGKTNALKHLLGASREMLSDHQDEQTRLCQVCECNTHTQPSVMAVSQEPVVCLPPPTSGQL